MAQNWVFFPKSALKRYFLGKGVRISGIFGFWSRERDHSFFGQKFYKFWPQNEKKSAGKYKGEGKREMVEKSARDEVKFLGIFRQNRSKMSDFGEFWGLIFTCVILLFDFEFLIKNSPRFRACKRREIGYVEMCPTRANFVNFEFTVNSKIWIHSNSSECEFEVEMCPTRTHFEDLARAREEKANFSHSQNASPRANQPKCVLHGHISASNSDFRIFEILMKLKQNWSKSGWIQHQLLLNFANFA